MSDRPFDDDRHALYVGWVLGIGMKHGIRFVPVVDEHGNYTNRLTLTTPGNSIITFIVPRPPDDWTPGDE